MESPYILFMQNNLKKLIYFWMTKDIMESLMWVVIMTSLILFHCLPSRNQYDHFEERMSLDSR